MCIGGRVREGVSGWRERERGKEARLEKVGKVGKKVDGESDKEIKKRKWESGKESGWRER